MHEILATASFKTTLAELSEQTGRSVADLQREAEADLKEMASPPGKHTVQIWDRFCQWLARAYQVDFDPAEVEKLRALNEQCSLVFLPNHRSYLDPLVLRSALAQHGFKPNNVLGGSNLALWPFSEIGRRNGIVFIRREFRDDHLYRAVLKTYLSDLIARRQNLEWYIEGGRTRTGKLRPPRYGVLSYVVDAHGEHPEHDVRIVPTSIIYDQQHEVEAISHEETGGTKTPESIGWMIRFARSQSQRLGRAYLRFGEPLSLQDMISLTLDDQGQPRPRLAVPKVALETCNRINEATPVTPSALVTFALLDNGDRAITVAEGSSVLRPLLDYIHRRNLPMTGHLDLDRHGLLRESLVNLVRQGVVSTFDGGEEPVFFVSLDHQHEAAFYRNTIIHFFINRAITELALMQAAEDRAEDIKSATWQNARRLKELLKFEFSFPTTMQFAEQIAAETSIVYPTWEEEDFTPESILEELGNLDLILAHRIVGPFLEAYSVFADELETLGWASRVDEMTLVSRCLGVARQRWLQKTLHNPEAISKDYFKNAYQLAVNQGLIGKTAEDLADRRKAFAEELRSAVRRVDHLRRIAQAAGQPVLLTERTNLPTGGDRG